MTINEDLKYFLKKGHLKDVSFNLNRAKLIEILGKTDWEHYSFRKDKYPSIYKYDKLEFYFNNQSAEAQINGIMFQPIPTPSEKGFLNCSYNGLTNKTTLNSVIEFLNTNEIKFSRTVDKWNEELIILITEGKVSMYFDNQSDPKKYVLHKAGRFLND